MSHIHTRLAFVEFGRKASIHVLKVFRRASSSCLQTICLLHSGKGHLIAEIEALKKSSNLADSTVWSFVGHVGLLLHLLQRRSHSMDLATHSSERQPCRSTHSDLPPRRAIWREELHVQASCGIFIHHEVDPWQCGYFQTKPTPSFWNQCASHLTSEAGRVEEVLGSVHSPCILLDSQKKLKQIC